MSGEMGFWDHLVELRKRILRSLVGVLVGFGVAYYFSEEIFNALMAPLCGAFNNPECKLQALGLMEAFLVYLKAGIIGGIFLAAPWIFYQLWAFVSPGLRPQERKYVIPFVLSATVMFVGGALFGYFLIFPLAFEFFIASTGPQVILQPSMEAYFNLAATLLIGLGFLFEVPVLTLLFHTLGLVKAASLWKTWRYAIIGIFIIAALFPTTDPLSLVLLGAPLSILYTLTLVLCSAIEKFGSKKPASVS
jgi:sec-independent protein translocase protein TatC